MIVGREAECARIDRLLADASAGASGVLVMTGEPGIGKSALCAYAVARADGMRVLPVRGVHSEADLPFAGLAELCAGHVDRLDALPEPQTHALAGALAQRVVRPADRFAIGAAVLSLLAVAGEGRPVLVVIDDAQWLDASSCDALAFAARRLRNEGVAMLVATRAGGMFDAERSGLAQLTLSGLPASAAQALLEAAHGSLPARVARLLADRSAGNPLALLEMPRLLSDAQLAGRQPIDEPLPVGPTLERLLLHRLSGLPDRTRTALLVVAASRAERVDTVVQALRVLGIDRSVLEPAEEGGVLAVESERFEFRHPLLRSAIFHGATGPARRRAHAALARVASGELRVWHQAEATVGGDETIAAALEKAASDARDRGAPAAAASALERAARLSPTRTARLRRLTEAARNAYLAGQPAFALELLQRALAATPDPLARADIQHLRGRILVMRSHADAGLRLLVTEAARIRDVEPDRAAAMLAEAALDCITSANIGKAVEVARTAYDVARSAGPPVQGLATAMLASALALDGRRREAAALIDRCLPALRSVDPLAEAGELVGQAALSCMWIERYELAAELLDRLIGSARAASAPTTLPYPLSSRAELDLRTGRWARAAAQAQEASELGHEMGQDAVAGIALSTLARLAAGAGEEARCQELCARQLRLVEDFGLEPGRIYVGAALGLLALGLGRVDAAIRELERVRALAERYGLREPGVVPWEPDLIEAYVRAGSHDAARRQLIAFQRQADRTGGRWSRGAAARCHGLLAEDSELDGWFVGALEQLEALPAPFEVARTHLCHGERLRRVGRRTEARRALRIAIEGFDDLGAAPWTARGQAELRATGATPRRRRGEVDPERLTPHEFQVAVTVAGGASNREAAAALFLSPKTIEFHLARIYRKLDLRGRSELVALAVRRGWLDGDVASDAHQGTARLDVRRSPRPDAEAVGRSLTRPGDLRRTDEPDPAVPPRPAR